jgi:hypothetical protein
MGTLDEDGFTLMISRLILKMRNVCYEGVEKMRTNVLCSITFFPKILPFVRLCGKVLLIREATREYNAVHAHLVLVN